MADAVASKQLEPGGRPPSVVPTAHTQPQLSSTLSPTLRRTLRCAVIIKALKAQGKDTSVILVPYKIEHFKRLAAVFDIWPYPRAHHNYASYVHLDSSIFILADGA